MPVLVKEKLGARWKLKGCEVCGGDLHWEEGKWVCLQCGRKESREYPFYWNGKKWRRLN